MKLISLNIEGDKHLDRVATFFADEKPDVICLQEAFEADSISFAERFGMRHVFAPMTLKDGREKISAPYGISMLSRFELENIRIDAYHAPSDALLEFDKTSIESMNLTVQRLLISASIKADEIPYKIATTHFTWTPDGLPTNYQTEDAESLLRILSTYDELVLCGDFNIPRGVNSLYEKFIARFRDAIPAMYASSLDMNFHRVRNNPEGRQRLENFMVDYLFLSEAYDAKDVRLEAGVSDHQAIVAEIMHHE